MDYPKFLCDACGGNFWMGPGNPALTLCGGFQPCIDYYFDACCQLYVPPDSLPSGGIELTPAVVDSVMSAFSLGFQSGVLSFIKIVGIAVITLVIVSLVNYVISKT